MKKHVTLDLTQEELAMLQKIVKDVAFDLSGMAKVSAKFLDKSQLADSLEESIEKAIVAPAV